MLEYFFGDTPQVRVIEYMIECDESWPMEYPSKEEIAKGANISIEDLNEFYDDFIDIGFLIKYENEDKHYMCSHELADGLFFVMQEIEPSYIRKMIDRENKLKEFLDKNYKFSPDNLDEITEYIADDQELCKIIYDLPQIISKEFQKAPVHLDFMDYTDSSEIVLQISIETQYDRETSSEKLDNILKELFKYKSPEKYYFITVEL